MTLKKVKKIYGEVPLNFVGYQAFNFNFQGDSEDGHTIYASFGGNCKDMEKFSIESNGTTLINLKPDYIRVSKGAKLVFEWMDN